MQALCIGESGESGPCLPDYDFWARSLISAALNPLGVVFPTMVLTVVADVAGSLVGVKFGIRIGGTNVQNFEITEGGSPTPGNIAVPITANNTAAQVATACATAILNYYATIFTALVATAANTPTNGKVLIAIGDPNLSFGSAIQAEAPFSPIALTASSGTPWGAFLYNSYRTFAFQGLAGLTPVVSGALDTYAPPIWGVRGGGGGVRVWPSPALNPFGIMEPVG